MRYVARQSVSTSELERAAGGPGRLVELVEEGVRGRLPAGLVVSLEWFAVGRGVDERREESWAPGWSVPWWAESLTCVAIGES